MRKLILFKINSALYVLIPIVHSFRAGTRVAVSKLSYSDSRFFNRTYLSIINGTYFKNSLSLIRTKITPNKLFNVKKNLHALFITILLLLALSKNGFCQVQTVTISTPGYYYWVPPCGISSVTIECWGGGGAGGAALSANPAVGGGGGGGAYTRSNINVIPGVAYYMLVGAGGTGGSGNGSAGESSWFISAATVMARGGNGGLLGNSAVPGTGGAGGSGNINIGTSVFNYNGGNGGTGPTTANSGGGGGGAGNAAVGGNASGSTAGTGGAVGGGNGAAGINTNNNGTTGTAPGGGGGGARRTTGATKTGGNGGAGRIVITYTGGPSYCNPAFTTVEPITSVSFAGISNLSSEAVDGSLDREIFCETGTVIRGSTYTMTVKGNTAGAFTNYISVFIDWNQNGLLDDAGERTNIGTIANSTGIDAISVSGNITVPVGALTGNTLMRVMKNYNAYATTSCTPGSGFGQAEDYMLNVGTSTACAAPLAQPTALVLTASTSSVAGSFTASGSANGYLVVRTNTAVAPSNPVNGTVYNTGSNVLGGIIESSGPAINFVSSGLLPGTQYWYWVFAYNAACTGSPVYLTAGPLTGNATTAACGAVTTLYWSGKGTKLTGTLPIVLKPDFNNPINWSTTTPAYTASGIAPNACTNVSVIVDEDLYCPMSQNTAINNFTFIGDADFITSEIALKGRNLVVRGNSLIDIATTAISAGINTVVKLGESDSLKQSSIDFHGNVDLGPDVNAAYISQSSAGFNGNANTKIIFRGNLTLGSVAAIASLADKDPENFIFDGAASQNITWNNDVYYCWMKNVTVGVSNSPTVNQLTGTVLPDNVLNTVQVNNNSVLNYGTSQWNRQTSGGSFTLNGNSQLRLGAASSSAIGGTSPGGLPVAGSNFPGGFTTYIFAAGSTVEYNGGNTIHQTVYAPVTYGNLTLSNITGSGSSIKSLTANITGIASNLTVNGFATFNQVSFTANRTAAGGNMTLNANASLRLSGSSGGQTGSNFPLNFSTMVANESSTIEYYGAGQDIFGGINYGNILLAGTANKTAPSGNLNVNGNFQKTSSTIYLHNNGNVLLGGTVAHEYRSVNPIINFYNLTNNNTVAYNIISDMGIETKLSAGSASRLVLSDTGDVIMRSSNLKTANVGILPNPATNITYTGSGRFVVERFIQTPRKWQFLAVPTSSAQTVNQAWQEGQIPGTSVDVGGYGTQISTLYGSPTSLGFDFTSASGHGMKYWNVTGQNYTPQPNTTSAIASSQGYMLFVRGNRAQTGLSGSSTTNLRTRGSLYTGTQSAIAVPAGQYVSLGNPYASALNMDNIPLTGMVQSFYLWDPKLYGTYGEGGFQTFTKIGADWIPNPGGGSFDVVTGSAVYDSSFIPSGQAFFVRGGAGASSISFDEADKSDNRHNATRINNTAEFLQAGLLIKQGSNPIHADGVIVQYDESFSNTIDNEDAPKIKNPSQNISITQSGVLLSVEKRDIIKQADTIFLQMESMRVQHYSWLIKCFNLNNEGRKAWFVDKYTGVQTTLDLSSENNLIDFDVINQPASYAKDRFMIVFEQAEILPVKITGITAIRNSAMNIDVKWDAENERGVNHYELQRSGNGTDFITVASLNPLNNGRKANYEYPDIKPLDTDNYYRIKIVNRNGTLAYSQSVMVEALILPVSIKLLSNPVLNKNLQLVFIKQAAGTYNWELVSENGQLVGQGGITVDGSYATRSVSLNKKLPVGNYMFSINFKGITAFSAKVLLQ